MWPVFLKFEKNLEIYNVSFEQYQRNFRVPVEISGVYRRYKGLWIFLHSVHYSIKYFKNNTCFPSIFIYLFFFS